MNAAAFALSDGSDSLEDEVVDLWHRKLPEYCSVCYLVLIHYSVCGDI